VTPSGIKAATLRLVARCLNQQRYRVPPLTFKNRAFYIKDRRTATLQMLNFIYFFQQI